MNKKVFVFKSWDGAMQPQTHGAYTCAHRRKWFKLFDLIVDCYLFFGDCLYKTGLRDQIFLNYFTE